MLHQETDAGILVCEWHDRLPGEIPAAMTSILTPMLDKPLLQRAIEQLVRLGCRHVHVLLGITPEPVRRFLAEGERWGITLRYHYRWSDRDLADNFKPLRLSPASRYWLASAETVPVLVPDEQSGGIGWRTGTVTHWSGWGCFSGDWLAGLKGVASREALEALLLEQHSISRLVGSPPLSASSDEDFLDSCKACLLQLAPEDGPQILPGKGAVLHPSARIDGSCYIGPLARIGAGANIGPNAVIGEGSVIDRGATVADSVVLPDTYVGIELELKHAIAAPGQLSSVAHGAVLTCLEPTLLAAVNQPVATRQGLSFMQRCGVLLLRVLLLPLYLLVRHWTAGSSSSVQLCLPGHLQWQQTVPLAPAISTGKPEERLVRHFSGTFYPGLALLPKGLLVLCGLTLRDASEVQQLPDYWRGLYANYRCGLLNEAVLLPADEATSSRHYACDAYACAHGHSMYAISLMLRYLYQVAGAVLRLGMAAWSGAAR
ncbi:Nucleotidyl transferase [Laribacter hongkongensis HLHK9]|uniref:Nucleotidyl transferase n=2 Tax=Laribacter hongkongensis TaxID=168471 RepID=C1D4L9_LARHH|nr:Nucleotidyl transferase [Laribacter hongkongensis HLHK9]